MTVMLTLLCGGCDATTQAGPLRRTFHSLSGARSGFGRWVIDNPCDLTPKGWVMYDPYTSCTYCPACWAEIDGDDGPGDAQ